MQSVFDFIFSDAGDLSIIITGIVSVISLVVTLSYNLSQNTFKKKDEYNNLLINKMQLIYSPLQYNYLIKHDYLISDDTDTLENIKKYSYFLSDDIYWLLKDIIEIENLMKTSTSKSINELSKKHGVYISTLKKYLAKEYPRLKACYNNIYKNSEKQFSVPEKNNLLNSVKNFFRTIAVIFIFLLLLLSLIQYFFNKYSINTTPPWLMIISIAIYIGFMILIIDFFGLIGWLIDKKFKVYKANAKVPFDSEFFCIYCKYKQKFFSNTEFPTCPNIENHSIFFRSTTDWKKVKDKGRKK